MSDDFLHSVDTIFRLFQAVESFEGFKTYIKGLSNEGLFYIVNPDNNFKRLEAIPILWLDWLLNEAMLRTIKEVENYGIWWDLDEFSPN